MRRARLLPLFAVLLLVSCFSAQADEPLPSRPDVRSAPSTDVDLDAEAQQLSVLTHEDEQAVEIQPSRPTSSVALASGTLRSAVELLERGQTAGVGLDVVDSKVRVEVLHHLESSEIRTVITDLGGTVEGEVKGVLVQALVPFDRLVALESHDGVQFVRPPLEANVPILPPSSDATSPQSSSPIVGEEVAKTNADAWHAAGYTGAGVKVGIVDYFDGTLWNNAVAAGELPTPAGTFCKYEGSSCDIWTADNEHGQAVAEIIYEMAPGAQLYLATARTVSDLQDAVDYFETQGVDIISRSLTAEYDGPGNGTGPIATVIDNAVANGIVWFNSAGNSASDGSFYGQYWRGQWADSDGDGWLDFAPGVELMAIWCPFTNGARWSDFGSANPTDYDVCVFDNAGDRFPIACSVDDQTTGAPPLELDIPCRSEWDYLAIALWDPGNGTSGDTLEFMTNGGAVEYWQNPYSASGPASDTASPGGLSVGAVDPPLGTDIAPYSSQGPTNDGLCGETDRIKPDISAAAGVTSYTYGTFSGTSASTPATAGAAALIIEAGLASTPAEVKTYLLNNATVDRGAPGPDNIFGVGELLLPPPPLEFSLDRLAEDTWRYFGWASTNHLPWSWKSPGVDEGHYANPAEIGLYMLAYLGAHALDSPWSPSASDTRTEVKATLDQLEAWQTGSQPEQPHGPNAYDNSVFFQWYWISWDPPVVGADCPSCDNQYVPSVDNAWLALSLITTREYAQAEGWSEVAEVADRILSRMDFGIWYDPATHLFSHGGEWSDGNQQWEQYDEGSETMIRAPDWDYYSNEGRIINFVARALGQLSEQEFADSLSALFQDPGTYDRGTPDPSDDVTVEKVNWDGSYFTYLAPALFIHERNTPYGEGTLDRATEAQIAYAEDKGYVYWGISDCFPPEGAYADRGAPPCANCDPVPDDGLITPHASALALNTSYASDAFTNLQELRGCGGVYSDDYGFKDSVYWDCSDVAERFVTLDQAWIFLSLVNHEKGTIWKHLYRDLGVITAHKEMYPIEDDSDNDGFIDSLELYIGTDPLDACSDDPSDDAWPPDINRDSTVNTLDVGKFRPVVFSQAGDVNYDRRFDLRPDGTINTLDVGKFRPVMFQSCAEFTFTNDTGGAVDDIHIAWNGAISSVFSAVDTDGEGWATSLGGDGLTLDADRPDGQWIVFVSNRAGSSDLYIMKPDGSSV